MRKSQLTIVFAIILFFGAFAQRPVIEVTSYYSNEIWQVVEVHPVFPGGYEAMREFIRANLQFPETDADTTSTIFVTFVVEADGTISNARILRGLTPDLNAEVLRVVNLMPKWTPGKQRGMPVRVQFNLPVRAPFHSTTQEAINTIRANYLFMFFRQPNDTTANINRLIRDINRVVPVDREANARIREQILAEMWQAWQPNREQSQWQAFYKSPNSTFTLNRFDIPDFIPIMGINANEIIRNNFSEADYKKIYERLVQDRIDARRAYLQLRTLYNQGKSCWSDWVIDNGIDSEMTVFHTIFEHFNIAPRR